MSIKSETNDVGVRKEEKNKILNFLLTSALALRYVISQVSRFLPAINTPFVLPINSAIRFIDQKNSTKHAFNIPLVGCGTSKVKIDIEEETVDVKGFENVIVIQNNPKYQEIRDSVRMIVCRYTESPMSADPLKNKDKRVLFKPFTVDMLDVITVPMSGALVNHQVDCWMDISRGNFPKTAPIDGAVKVGENLTMTIYIKDAKRMTDLRVKDCYAFDSRDDAINGGEPILQLTSERGCPIKSKLIDNWRTTSDTGSSGATVMAYTTITAFKFPERENVFLSCNVELCTNGCLNFCDDDTSSLSPILLDSNSGTTTASPPTTSVSVTTAVSTTVDSNEDLVVSDRSTGAAALPDEDGASNASDESDSFGTDLFSPTSGSLDLTRIVDTTMASFISTSTTTTSAPTTSDPIVSLLNGTNQVKKNTISPVLAALIQTTTNSAESQEALTTSTPRSADNFTLTKNNSVADDAVLDKKKGDIETNDKSAEDNNQRQSRAGTKSPPPPPPRKSPPRAVVKPKPKPTPTSEEEDEPTFPESEEETDLLEFPVFPSNRGSSRPRDGIKGIKTPSGPQLEQIRVSRRIPAFVPRPQRGNLQVNGDGSVPGEEKAAQRSGTSSRSKKLRNLRHRSSVRNSWHTGPLPENRDPGYHDVPVHASRLSRRVVRPPPSSSA